jgi:hypothetical protein
VPACWWGLIVGSTLVASSDNGKDKKSPVGTWRYKITAETPPSPAPTAGVLALNSGGGLVNIDQRAVAGRGSATPGLGTWETTSPGKFQLTFEEFLNDGTGQLSTLTLRGTGELDDAGDKFTASGRFEITSAAGQVVFSATNAIEATRMPAA